MEYKLCKELKDAGFPQLFDGEGGDIIFPNDEEQNRYYNSEGKDWKYAYDPTLDELIEECGETNHFVLMKMIDVWQAGMGENALQGITAEGKTRKEAVSKLWFKLNKK